MSKANEPPTQQELTIAVLELARNHHFHVVVRYIRAEREDLIYNLGAGIGPRADSMGIVSRFAGGVTALSGLLDQFIAISKTLDGTVIGSLDAGTDQGAQPKAP